ncbi:hypothetical protein GCM10017559_41670 [Streptosporangium longisporum]|uniref:NB-ARC domain-containing protein n=1 Tax=Streptosporangium longisporum TaxID=46187 RepID=A0ABP6KNG6_9ACTN
MPVGGGRGRAVVLVRGVWMTGAPNVPDQPDLRSPARRPGRRIRLAAPAAAGLAAAMASVLATSLDVWELPLQAKVGVTALAGLLVGLLTWATAGSRGPEERGASAGTVWRPPDQWPPVTAHFTGRTGSLAELREVFAARRRSRDHADAAPLVVSVYGRGGVGKSALIARFGNEIADDFPDGRLYADLRGQVEAPVDPAEVLIGFLRALGVRLTTDPGGLAELRTLWLTWTKGRRILIFLDNARDGDQVKSLIPAEPGCAVMVTSRQPLFLLNTYDKQLSVFDEAQGVELLARLAGNDRVSADPEAAREIVRMCDHLPLAIGICGGRLATRENWTLRRLADRLLDERRRLDQLEIARSLDKSVRASLQLSYDDCTGLQRRLLRLLSLVAAPDVPGWVAGELLATSEVEGADQLEALIDAQLAECSGTDLSGVMRYRLHDLVKIFAREPALTDDEARRRAAIERVLSGYRRRAEAAAVARWPQDWGRVRPAGQDPGPEPVTRAEVSAADWLNAERLTLVAVIGQARSMEMWELALGPGQGLLLAVPLAAGLLVGLAGGRRDPVRGRGADGRPAGPGHRAAGPGGGGGRAGRSPRRPAGRRAGAGGLRRARRVLVGGAGDARGRHDAVQRRQPRPGAGPPDRRDHRLHRRGRPVVGGQDPAQPRRAPAGPAQARRGAGAAGGRAAGVRARPQTATPRRRRCAPTARCSARRPGRCAPRVTTAPPGTTSPGPVSVSTGPRRCSGSAASCGRRPGACARPARSATRPTRCASSPTCAGPTRSWSRSATRGGSPGPSCRPDAPWAGWAVRARRAPVWDGPVRAFEELGDRWWMARSLRYLGEAHLEAGDDRAAVDVLRRAQDIYRSLGNRSGMNRTLELLRRAGG